MSVISCLFGCSRSYAFVSSVLVENIHYRTMMIHAHPTYIPTYLPTYTYIHTLTAVEWLGDTAANIIFDDAAATQRALEGTSILLPSMEEVMDVPKDEEAEGGVVGVAGGKKGEKPLDISEFGKG